TTLTVGTGGGVMANDTDADGDALTATLGTGPSHGSLTFRANGSFDYTPAAGYLGGDSFTYTASDGLAASSTVTVSLGVVSPVPDQTNVEGNSVSLTVPALGPVNAQASFSAAWLPAGLSIAPGTG